MKRADIELHQSCLACEMETVVIHAIVVRGLQLRHSEAWNCLNCRYTAELDGDELPTHVAQALILRDGQWVLRIKSVSCSLVDGIRPLAEGCAMEEREALQMLKNAAAKPVLFSGIRAQVAAIASYLEVHGIRCEVGRIDVKISP